MRQAHSNGGCSETRAAFSTIYTRPGAAPAERQWPGQWFKYTTKRNGQYQTSMGNCTESLRGWMFEHRNTPVAVTKLPCNGDCSGGWELKPSDELLVCRGKSARRCSKLSGKVLRACVSWLIIRGTMCLEPTFDQFRRAM